MISAETMAAINGACVVICLALVAITCVAWIAKQFNTPRVPSEAEMIGQELLDEFCGDVKMARIELARIRAKRRLLVRVANRVAKREKPSAFARAVAEFGEDAS